jgi:MoaA/NifB/PqqE/SkfB family radical SAM enzyme
MDIYPGITENKFLEKYDEVVQKYRGKIKILTHKVRGINHADNNAGEPYGLCAGGDRIIFVDHNGVVAPCSWIRKVAGQFASNMIVFESGFNECVNEMDRFRKTVKQRSELTLHGCPFIALQSNGEIMTIDPRFKIG